MTAEPCDKWLELRFAADEGQWWYRDAPRWFKAVEFGVHYANEQIGWEVRKVHKGVRISVDEVIGTHVDTTEIAMAYTAAMAFFDATEVSPERSPTWDVETRSVTFPA